MCFLYIFPEIFGQYIDVVAYGFVLGGISLVVSS